MLWRGVNKWKLCYPQERFIQWTALSTLAPLEPGQLTNHPVILSDQPVSLSAGLIFSQLPIFLLQIPQSLYRLHIAQVFLNMWWYLRPWHLMILPTEEALLGKQLLPLKGPHPEREKNFVQYWLQHYNSTGRGWDHCACSRRPREGPHTKSERRWWYSLSC